MRKKKRALVDVDGVLLDFLTPSFAIIEMLTGKQYKPSDLTTWDIFDTVGKQWEQAFFDVCNLPGFARRCQPLPGAVEGMRRLQEVAEVYIVTSPMNHNPTWTHERVLSLMEHFGIHHKKIVHTSAKYLCVGDVLVDDRPSNIEAWEAEHLNGTGLLWDQPYNRDSKAGFRVLDWDQVLKVLNP